MVACCFTAAQPLPTTPVRVCASAGDAFILDTRTFKWHTPTQLNTGPAPRYQHTCCLIGGRVVLYGGINSKQTIDGVVLIEVR